jgi:hypothetical protein
MMGFHLHTNSIIYDKYTEMEYKILSYNKHQVTLNPIGTNKKKYFGIESFFNRFTSSKLEIRRLKIKKILDDENV